MHKYVEAARACIRKIESIYPSVGKAMYDEPRERLAFAIDKLVADAVEADRRERKCVHELAREFSENVTTDFSEQK